MKSVLISGAGIAGPTLAYWLLQHGFQPTIVEQAPSLRTSGYVIDFWGVGYDVAGKMDVLADLNKKGYHAKEVLLVDKHGRRAGGFSTDIFTSNLDGRFVSLLRGDLAETLYRSIEGRVEVIFGDCIKSIRMTEEAAEVEFDGGAKRNFDLVAGADGLHSVVRSIAFGAEEQFEKKLGYSVAAFSVEGYEPRDEDVYVCYSSPGKQIARFALRDNITVFFLIFRDSNPEQYGRDQATSKVETILNDDNWECKKILRALHNANDLYFDSVSQIIMPSWSKERAVLVGDAAFCPSLLAGQGSALAMAGSYVLAGELKRASGDHKIAFAAYEKRLRAFIEKKQKGAENFGKWFAPDTQFAVFLRNQITKLFAIPFFADKFVRDTIADELRLPDYS
ncbi:FAD-binding domain [Candidatus Obscuribacterales bacterium]|nr:FAD-binding domain [Candidatus Obscuribacterales bacterium]